MIIKKGYLVVLLLVIALASSVYAGSLTLNRPSGSGVSSVGCPNNGNCQINGLDQFCDEEGQWRAVMEANGASKTANAQNVNWDSQKYCTPGCTGKQVQYHNTPNQCCGDDISDCGAFIGGAACGDHLANVWDWVVRGEEVGVIKNFACNDAFFVAAPNKVYSCGPGTASPFIQQIIDDRQYICFGDAIADDQEVDFTYSIAECAGNDPPKSDRIVKNTGGKVYSKTEFATVPSVIGDLDGNLVITLTDLRIAEWMLNNTLNLTTICAVDIDQNEVFDSADITGLSNLVGTEPNVWCFDNAKNRQGNVKYCSIDNTFITDLDAVDARSACINAEFENYFWTGSRCCQEPEDFEEYYNDPYVEQIFEFDAGGCWNSTYTPMGEITPGTDQRIANFNGTFYGCGLNETDKTKYDRGGIITNETNPQECQQFIDPTTDQYLLCQENGRWTITSEFQEIERKTTENITLEEGGTQTGCCDVNSCWDGFSCVGNQKNTASFDPSYDCQGDECFRCIDGKWQQTNVKEKWDNSAKGYCPLGEQCLVNPLGDELNNNNTESYFSEEPPQCVSNDQYITDFLCDQGNWSTRTKVIAAQMLDFAKDKNEFTFFCDNFIEALAALPSTDEGLFTGCQIGESIEDCVNTVCLLSYEDKVGVGASLNHPIDGPKSFLQVLGEPTILCGSVQQDLNSFQQCGTSKVWYNPVINSLIYMSDDILIPSQDLGGAIVNFIKNPFETIKTKLFEVAPPEEFGFFNNTRIFNRIYASKTADKTLFAFFEEGQWEGTIVRDYIGVSYEGLTFDTCELVQNYDFLATCTQEGNDFTIVRQRLPAEPSTLLDAWKDITSKLRPQNEQ